MPFVGAVITPHSPLLLPSVGKEYRTQTKKTIKSLELLAHELHAMSPETLLIIHPHGQQVKRAFALNVADTYNVSFKDFGDLVTTASLPGDPALAHLLKEQAEDAGFPLTLTHTPNLSYDAAVPLICFGQEVLNIPVLTLGPSPLDSGAHARFGMLLADSLHLTKRRVAVVISAELSQHASAAATTGFRPEGAAFDEAVTKALGKKMLTEKLLGIDAGITALAEACGYAPLVILSGLLSQLNCHIRKISYESPFGIGLLTAVIHPA